MIFEQIAGAAIILIFLADIFLTVLYARVGTSLIARPMNHLLWRLIKHAPNIGFPTCWRQMGFVQRLLSLRRAANSLRSVVVSAPLDLPPASTAACLTHPITALGVKPSSIATPFGFFPGC